MFLIDIEDLVAGNDETEMGESRLKIVILLAGLRR